MTKEEAKKFGLQLLHGIMERNESYPVYANNVKQAIDALSEESGSSEIPNDLEEAAGSKLDDFDAVAYMGNMEEGQSPLYDMQQMLAMFIAGAKWQKEQDRLEIANIKAKLWQDGFDDCKEQMMKEAVEIGTTEICWVPDGERVFPTFDPPVDDLLMPGIISQRFNEGDKVRVIVLKKED